MSSKFQLEVSNTDYFKLCANLVLIYHGHPSRSYEQRFKKSDKNKLAKTKPTTEKGTAINDGMEQIKLRR